jgi:hypothetical protein
MGSRLEDFRKLSSRQTSSRIDLYPKLQTLNRLHLPVIRAVEIRLCGPNVWVAHQGLNGSKVIPIIQKGRRKGVAALVSKN